MSERTIHDLMRDIQIWMEETKRELAARDRAENMFSDS